MSVDTPTVDRDRWGRYMVLGPDGQKAKPYTRATTIASTLDDQYGLTNWKLRTCALGLAARHDIYALISSTNTEDKKKLDKLCADALEAGAASSGANLGSALHAFTEQIDRGEKITPPSPLDLDIEAYRFTLETHGVKILPRYIERVVVLDEYQIAGTFDRIVQLADGRNVIADLKTGQSLDYSWQAIAIQLAIYANADNIYRPDTGFRDDLPNDLDPTIGLVIHLPAGKATCTLHTVDLVAGWEACELALQVRAWRKTKGLSAPYLHDATRPAPPNKRAAIIGRLEMIREHGDLNAVAANWPAHIPTLKAHQAHTSAELDEIAAMLTLIEAEQQIPF